MRGGIAPPLAGDLEIMVNFNIFILLNCDQILHFYNDGPYKVTIYHIS